MTALRFQTGGRHQTSPAALRKGGGGGGEGKKNTQRKCEDVYGGVGGGVG